MSYDWIKPDVLAVTVVDDVNHGAVLRIKSLPYEAVISCTFTGRLSQGWIADIEPITPIELGSYSTGEMAEYCSLLRPLDFSEEENSDLELSIDKPKQPVNSDS